MASINTARKNQIFTHEGAPAQHINAEQQLRRSVMSCLLWEKEFYEDGIAITERIESLIPKVKPEIVADIAIEARSKMNLRHIPLFIARVMAKLPDHKKHVANVLEQIVQRPDELTEFLAIYWKDKRQPVSAQVKKGLARAFTKFNEYSLAKYNRDGAVKLRDVLFISHAKPKDTEQESLFKKLVTKELATPDTWEVALSAGEDKKAAFERLLKEDKLGGLALLRNLRNMNEANVDRELIISGLKTMKTDKILPFRFIAAARYAQNLEPYIEIPLLKSAMALDKMRGTTVVMVDVSGSMDSPMSSKSDLWRVDAACGLAILLREMCHDTRVVTFSDALVEVPARSGFALADAIKRSQKHSGTYLGDSLKKVMSDIKYDRLIVITDEQAQGPVPQPKGKKNYLINVASAQNGIGYHGWHHIDGFSEAILNYILAVEETENE